jgi:hypothetical protein
MYRDFHDLILYLAKMVEVPYQGPEEVCWHPDICAIGGSWSAIDMMWRSLLQGRLHSLG